MVLFIWGYLEFIGSRLAVLGGLLWTLGLQLGAAVENGVIGRQVFVGSCYKSFIARRSTSKK